MTTKHLLKRRLKRHLSRKQDRLPSYPGTLGDGFGNLTVPGRPGYVYVRVNGAIEQAFNNRVPAAENEMLVTVGYDVTQPGLYQILETRSGSPGGSSGVTPSVITAKRFQWFAEGGGQDPLFVELRQFLPLRPGISSGMDLQVYRGFVQIAPDTFFRVPTQTMDLTAHIPAPADQAAFVLITVDDSGSLVATKGTEVDLDLLDYTTDIPAKPTGTVKTLAAVRVYTGQLAIQEARTNTDIIDLRFTDGSGGGSSAGTIDPFAIAFGDAAGAIISDPEFFFELAQMAIWLGSASALAGFTGAAMNVIGDGVVARLRAITFGSNTPGLTTYHADGTLASPTNTKSGMVVGRWSAGGWNDTPAATSTQAEIRAVATANWTTTSQPVKWEILVTPAGSTTLTLAMTIGDDGNVELANGINIPTGETYNINGSPHGHAGDEITGIREVLAAARTYYVRHVVGDATITIASPAVVTKTSHGLSADDPIVFSILAKRADCTMTIASPCVVTRVAHGFVADQPIIFETTGALPTGLVAGTTYFVKSPAADTFNVAATAGGADINTSGTQSGTHFVRATGALPTGLVEGTVYYVLAPATDTFNVAATPGGAAINTSGTQSGIFSLATGNDSNDGLTDTREGALLTIQEGVDLYAALDSSIYQATIQLGSGTFSSGAANTLKQGLGSEVVIIVGDEVTPSNTLVRITLASTALFSTTGINTTYSLRGMQMQSTGGSGFAIIANKNSIVEFQNIDINSGFNQQIRAADGGTVTATGNYTISSGATASHITLVNGKFRCQNFTVTLTGTPAFSAFISFGAESFAIISGNTFSGSATGKHYSGHGNSLLLTTAAGAASGWTEADLPGNALGTLLSGAEYNNFLNNYRVSTQFDKTNTSLAAITGLAATMLLAGRTYKGRLVCYTTSNIAGGINFDFDGGTVTATSFIAEAEILQAGALVAPGTGRSTALATDLAMVTAVTAATVIIEFTITVNAAGTLTPRFACNAAVGTSSVLVGSNMVIEDITP